ncbi:MAG: hypothetical protein M3O46_01535 [Myxococcota bacterium]|nr:hypothetical protein [Myxococcota bacterium]
MTMTTTNYGIQGSVTAAAGSPDAQPTGHDLPTTALLPEPALAGLCDGSMAALAMLLTKADQQDRTESRQIEDTADQAASRDDSDRVAQLQAKASADESQALVTGIAGMVGGACMAVGACLPSASALNQNVGCDATVSHGFDWNGALNTVGKELPDGGQVVSGQYRGAGDRAEADAAKFEAQAQADIRRYGQAHEDAQAANESIQKVEQFLNNVQQTENATRLTAATYRA